MEDAFRAQRRSPLLPSAPGVRALGRPTLPQHAPPLSKLTAQVSQDLAPLAAALGALRGPALMAHALRRLLGSLGSADARLEAAALVLQRACTTPPQAATVLAAAVDALSLSPVTAAELAARLARLAERTPPQFLAELGRAAHRFAAGDAARGAAVAAAFPASADGAG